MTHVRAPQPFILDDPLDYESGRLTAKTLNERRAAARSDFESATEQLVNAERAYRKGRALKIVEAPAGTVDEKKVWLDSETADLRHKRDGAEWAVKIIQERLAELDAQRASLHRLLEWSMRLDPLAAEVYAPKRQQAHAPPQPKAPRQPSKKPGPR